jgi:hypothetical protein
VAFNLKHCSIPGNPDPILVVPASALLDPWSDSYPQGSEQALKFQTFLKNRKKEDVEEKKETSDQHADHKETEDSDHDHEHHHRDKRSPVNVIPSRNLKTRERQPLSSSAGFHSQRQSPPQPLSSASGFHSLRHLQPLAHPVSSVPSTRTRMRTHTQSVPKPSRSVIIFLTSCMNGAHRDSLSSINILNLRALASSSRSKRIRRICKLRMLNIAPRTMKAPLNSLFPFLLPFATSRPRFFSTFLHFPDSQVVPKGPERHI